MYAIPSASPNDDVMYANFRSVCENYFERGVTRFLVARAIENDRQLKLCSEIIQAPSPVVCRLDASLATMERRVCVRDAGMSQRELVARVAQLSAILDRARLEEFSISNENRSLTDVAQDMLVKAGWIEH